MFISTEHLVNIDRFISSSVGAHNRLLKSINELSIGLTNTNHSILENLATIIELRNKIKELEMKLNQICYIKTNGEVVEKFLTDGV